MSSPRNPWIPMCAVFMGSCLGLMDTTIVNVAIPSLIEDLHATLDQILWVSSAYTLMFAVLLVTGGRLGDRYGPKLIYQVGLVLFTVASAACGLAQSPEQLIVARAVQGIGAALFTPQSVSLVIHLFPAERRGTAFGVWGAVAGVSVVLGPTLGGVIVTYLGWQWVFLINVPLGIVAVALAAIVVPEVAAGQRHRFDLLGAIVLTLALFLVVFGLLEGEPHHWGTVWGPVTVPVIIMVGVVLLVAFAAIEHARQGSEPLVPFTILRQRNFVLMIFVAAVMSLGVASMSFLTLLYLQLVSGASALAAGHLVAVAPAMSVLVAPLSGRLTDRFGGKYVLFSGLVLLAAGTLLLSMAAGSSAGWWEFLPGLMSFGLGMGVTFAPPGTMAMADIESSMIGAASGVFNMTRLCGSAVGGASVGGLLQVQLGRDGQTAGGALAGAIQFTYLLPAAFLLVGVLLTLAVRQRSSVQPQLQNTGR